MDDGLWRNRYLSFRSRAAHKCEDLEAFLKKDDIKHDEWSLYDVAMKRKLAINPKFTDEFCNIDGCIVYTHDALVAVRIEREKQNIERIIYKIYPWRYNPAETTHPFHA